MKTEDILNIQKKLESIRTDPKHLITNAHGSYFYGGKELNSEFKEWLELVKKTFVSPEDQSYFRRMFLKERPDYDYNFDDEGDGLRSSD